MRNMAQAMTELIASAVAGKKIDGARYAFSEEELTQLYRLSKAHDLVHLVGDSLIRNGLLGDSGIRAKFEKQMLAAGYRCERLRFELNALRGVLNGAHIPFLPLKGAVLREYYPEAWMRTSCDIDVLIHEEDLERTVDLLIEKLSYRKDEKGAYDVGMFSPGGIHVEIHYSIIEDNMSERTEAVCRSVWDYSTAVEGTSEYVMDDAMFYYYHVAHMAKHFVNGGCGIRPFLDLRILNGRAYDWEKRSALLTEGGLDVFEASAQRLSSVWFGSGEHDALTAQMERFLLEGGSYGTTETRVSVQQVKRGGKIRYAFSRIFLPYNELKYQYPSLEGKKILLPFYEVRRWFKLLFFGGVKRSMRELKANSATDREERETAKQMLSDLHLM